MVCAWPEMIQRTRSPIDTTPSATPSSTTGRWTKAMVRHNGHALIHRVLGSDKDNRAGHDLTHQGLLRGVALEDHLARVIALRQDTDQPALGRHEHCADTLCRHLLNGLVDGLIGHHGDDPIAFLGLQQRVNFVSDVHGCHRRSSSPHQSSDNSSFQQLAVEQPSEMMTSRDMVLPTGGSSKGRATDEGRGTSDKFLERRWRTSLSTLVPTNGEGSR
jgi:hypothetical protein